MAEFETLFPTLLYRATLDSQLNAELEKAILFLAAEDRAGIHWCKANDYKGYTSFASINDLPRRAPVFAELEKHLDKHIAAFSDAEFDMGLRTLMLDSIWLNVMDTGAIHAPHIHPYCVVSGTYYVTVPPGAGALVFEDPRLPFMMAAPPRKPGNSLARQNFVAVPPQPGLLLLWESWLRHGVEPNKAKTPRISISFNYRVA
jgi:uncharacterized protein (TIGR02466 family)